MSSSLKIWKITTVTLLALTLISLTANVYLTVQNSKLRNFISALGPVTREGAIHLSRNTPSVQEFLEDATTHWVNATYSDEELVRLWKEGNPERFSNLPDDHGVWEIVWTIRLKPSGISQTSLYHYVDEETGEILVELRGITLF